MAIEGIQLLFDLGLILLAATVFNFVARLLKQPSLLAYIAAGIVIGPIGLGALNLSFAGVPIGVTTTEEILLLSELGVAFLLFSVGVESDFSKLKEFGKIAVIGSVVQVVLTALLVFFFNIFLNILSFEQAIYLGLIVAFSSTTIVVKLLSDEHEINTLHGRLMIGFLLIQDVLVILALPLLDNISNFLTLELIIPLVLKVVALLVFGFVLNKYIYPRLFAFATQSDELFFLSAMSSVFIFIFISTILNFSIAVGAFVAGVTLSTLPYNLEVLHRIRGVRDFLATIFFVTLGIQLTFTFVSFPIALALVIIGIVFVFKPLIYYLITLFNGYGGRVSLMVALGLAQVSEFSFIIASQGRSILEQTPGLYSFIILIIAVSMAITPYFMGYTNFFHDLVNKIFGRFLDSMKNSKRFNKRIHELESVEADLKNHIVIFGGGTVGSNIASALALNNNKVVVVDANSETVLKNINKGINAVYGSADNKEIWLKVNILESKIVILAIPSPKSAIPLLKYLQKEKPGLVVFARAHYFKDAMKLYENSVDYIVMPQVLGSNVFVQKVAEYLETGDIERISNFKEEFVEYIKEKSKEEELPLF
ncbi:MAG: hypothetical protein COV47_04935 [Candidatus Diapherotrites archaeon CG11_big_fil_rev_8_21_14_0_20_37_9]|nr:MAG: hypothetical protein COV47_04935 [Candidatus Diapherotrites archaeon CG11_big_fil_rev_8_21_14_0_20_37_9]